MDDWLRNRIIGAGREIGRLPHAFVDRGIGQGRQAIIDHLDPLPASAKRAFETQPCYAPLARETPAQRADRVIAGIAAYLSELDTWLAPHHLPEDYRSFVAYYGASPSTTRRTTSTSSGTVPRPRPGTTSLWTAIRASTSMVGSLLGCCR